MDCVILELQAAMGGDDALKFVSELSRAYLRHAAGAG